MRRDGGAPRIIELHLIIISSCPTSQPTGDGIVKV
jgi:hypothetical protein